MGLITFLYFIISVLAAFGFKPECNASFRNDLNTQLFQYASENAPTFYASNKTIFDAPRFLGKADFYFESGPRGAWSFDPDPIRYRMFLDENKHDYFWAGRDHPLHLIEEHPIEVTSALGSIWSQNQLDALNPKVSGWLGMGWVHDFNPTCRAVLTYSPLFLPTFSPSLGFSERGDLNPARFARLPPEAVSTGGVTLPIRYQLRLDQLSELLLRHQVFMGTHHSSLSTSSDLFIYTAPKPEAIPLTDASLSIHGSDLNARVLINPQFPREYWGGFRFQKKDLLFEPRFEFLQNLTEYPYHLISITGFFKPQANLIGQNDFSPRASFGILTHFQKQFEAPQFSDFMIFLRVPVTLTAHLVLRTLIETTLIPSRRSLYLMNELEYSLHDQLALTGGFRILAGEDRSYFGAWRNQSTLSLGVRQTW